jgi:hypothetical protein
MIGGTTVNRVAAALRNTGAWSDPAIAGILGTWEVESGSPALNPVALNAPEQSFGLAQWRGPRLAALARYAKARGKSINDPMAQVGFFNQEMAGDPAYSKANVALRAAATPEDAVAAMNAYERPQGYKAKGAPQLKGVIAVNRRVNAANRSLANLSPDLAPAGSVPAPSPQVASVAANPAASIRRVTRINPGAVPKPTQTAALARPPSNFAVPARPAAPVQTAMFPGKTAPAVQSGTLQPGSFTVTPDQLRQAGVPSPQDWGWSAAQSRLAKQGAKATVNPDGTVTITTSGPVSFPAKDPAKRAAQMMGFDVPGLTAIPGQKTVTLGAKDQTRIAAGTPDPAAPAPAPSIAMASAVPIPRSRPTRPQVATRTPPSTFKGPGQPSYETAPEPSGYGVTGSQPRFADMIVSRPTRPATPPQTVAPGKANQPSYDMTLADPTPRPPADWVRELEQRIQQQKQRNPALDQIQVPDLPAPGSLVRPRQAAPPRNFAVPARPAPTPAPPPATMQRPTGLANFLPEVFSSQPNPNARVIAVPRTPQPRPSVGMRPSMVPDPARLSQPRPAVGPTPSSVPDPVRGTPEVADIPADLGGPLNITPPEQPRDESGRFTKATVAARRRHTEARLQRDETRRTNFASNPSRRRTVDAGVDFRPRQTRAQRVVAALTSPAESPFWFRWNSL